MELPVNMNSLWEATAQDWIHEKLDGPAEAAIVVIGAGITGLSAALKAAEADHKVIVLDAHHPGWGASGRNGGQVIPGLKELPDEIVRRFGADRGEQIVDFAGRTAETVFETISHHHIDCDAHRGGWVEPAYHARALRGLVAKSEQWQARNADVELLDKNAIAEATGSDVFLGGFHDRRAGSVHPLKYSLGLGVAARKAGALIYSHVTVKSVDQQTDGFIVETNKGQIRADRVLMCTNGYTDPSFGPVGRSVAPVASIQIATDPLPDILRQKIMPKGISGSDTNRLLVYFRLDAEGRFLIGGRGATFASGLERLFPKLQRHATRMFPDLADVTWPYRWGGLLALTSDHYPKIHEPVPGFVMAMGYNGRGVALATQWGAAISDYALSGNKKLLPIPITPIKQFPFHRLRTVGIEVAAFWYGFLDRMGV
ncbi:MAG: FAD-binding oxidoreductase [Alphaproteobacteria bacterium]|jgi:glycine/D-amino acid oxidase-like deaminating enzyme|nr:FAD-binding oxidoreductase [Alphaproteobacteria bacterium]MBT4545609.1 FAD-binding oxidoreductase [Alphaproteobacteria bacterium]